MSADVAVGMMDGAYFTSRSELLDFFNNLFDLNLTKIEQTASGAVACQLMDYLFPGSIPLKRVNWDTKNSYEYVQNYKLLQAAFTKNRVQKYIDVDKLIRGKYQDNLEFCQWLKAFHDQQQMHGEMRDDYDPVAAREKGKGGKKVKVVLEKTAAKPVRRPSRRVNPTPTSVEKTSATQSRKPSSNNNRPPSATRTTRKEDPLSTINKSTDISTSTKSREVDTGLLKKNEELTSRNAELELTVAEIEKERDFYFEKLRDVEVLLQVHQEKYPPSSDHPPSDSKVYDDLIKNVFKVLYATTEDKVIVSDEGELLSEKELENMASNMELSETVIEPDDTREDGLMETEQINDFVGA